MTNDWAVFRLDYSANEFLVKEGLSEKQARELAAEYESHGHHQHYWVDRIPKTEVDYCQMLDEQFRNGSPLKFSLHVLKNQNATLAQCVVAVAKTKGLTEEEARELVDKSGVFKI